MTITGATAFELPNGTRIDISTDGGKFILEDGFWKSLEITKVGPDGRQAVICALDFDSRNGMTLKVYDECNPESVFEKKIPEY